MNKSIPRDPEEDPVIEVPASERVEILPQKGYTYIHLPYDVDWTDVGPKEEELRELFVNPGITVVHSPARVETPARFFADYPAHSVAIDAFVPGLFYFQSKDEGGPRAIIDHHLDLSEFDIKLDRTILRSTCEQVYRRIRNGFFRKHFSDENGKINLNIFFNDLDEDVLLSLYQFLRLPEIQGRGRDRPLFRLVNHEGIKDADGGSFSLSDSESQDPDAREEDERLKWVFERCDRWKTDESLQDLGPEAIAGLVIGDTFRRIDAYRRGQAQRIALDMSYSVLWDDTEHGWSLVDEHGHEARMQMENDGVSAVISCKQEGVRGRVFTLWKVDDASNWPVEEIAPVLDRLERLKAGVQRKLRKQLQDAPIEEHFDIARELKDMQDEDKRLRKTHPQGVGHWGVSERGGGPPREGTWMWKELVAAIVHTYLEDREEEKEKNGNGHEDPKEEKERKEGANLFKENGNGNGNGGKKNGGNGHI
jgi:hypothetical protein